MARDSSTFLAALQEATNNHDLDSLVDCFAEGYRNDTPAHPSRSFNGRGQVRSNWQQIFGSVPDLRAEVIASAADGDRVWSEWEMRGTRRDGSVHCMRGTILFGVSDGKATWARFYLEPVDEDHLTVTDAVRAQVHAPTTP